MLIKDFVKENQRRDWLVKGLLPQGHVILVAGLGGAGKSLVAEDTAIHIAGGKPSLGLPVTKGPVILIDEDTPTDELQNRLERLTAGLSLSLDDLPIRIHSFENFRFDDEQSLQNLEKEAAEFSARLIIFDCLGKMMGNFDENSAKDCNRAGAAWNRLKVGGRTIMVLHHFGKREGNTQRDFIKLIRGSGALVANSDTAFAIEPGTQNPTTFNIYPVERRRKLDIREPFGIQLSEDKEQTWVQLEWAEVKRELSDLAKDIFPLFHKDKAKLDVYEVKRKLRGFAGDRDIRLALQELEGAKLLRRGRARHNRYVYSLNEDLFGP